MLAKRSGHKVFKRCHEYCTISLRIRLEVAQGHCLHALLPQCMQQHGTAMILCFAQPAFDDRHDSVSEGLRQILLKEALARLNGCLSTAMVMM
jgi:hypothetical protein